MPPMKLELTKQRYVASYSSSLLPTELSGQNKDQEEYKFIWSMKKMAWKKVQP